LGCLQPLVVTIHLKRLQQPRGHRRCKKTQIQAGGGGYRPRYRLKSSLCVHFMAGEPYHLHMHNANPKPCAADHSKPTGERQENMVWGAFCTDVSAHIRERQLSSKGGKGVRVGRGGDGGCASWASPFLTVMVALTEQFKAAKHPNYIWWCCP